VGLLTALLQVILSFNLDQSKVVFGGAFIVDHYSLTFKLLFIIIALFSYLLSIFGNEISKGPRSEFYVFIIAATTGMCKPSVNRH